MEYIYIYTPNPFSGTHFPELGVHFGESPCMPFASAICMWECDVYVSVHCFVQHRTIFDLLIIIVRTYSYHVSFVTVVHMH
jgi:hypothetical protein